MNDEKAQSEKLLRKLEFFVSQRDKLAAADSENWKSHDQAILTLSAAALGLSVTLLDKTGSTFVLLLALYLSWLLFIVAIISTLVSFRVASAALQLEIAQVDRDIANIREKPGETDPNVRDARDDYATDLKRLNLASAWAFALALCALAVFGFGNFARKGNLLMSNIPPDKVKKGAPIIQPVKYPQDPAPTSPKPAPTEKPPSPAKK